MCPRDKKCICRRKQHANVKQVNKITKFKHQANYTRKRLPQGAPEPWPKRSARVSSRGVSGSKTSCLKTTRRSRSSSKNVTPSEPNKFKNSLENYNPTTSEKCIQVEEPESKSFGVWATELALYYLQRLSDIYSSANTRKRRLLSCCSCHPLRSLKDIPPTPSFEKLRLYVNECQPKCKCKAQQIVMMALQFGEDQGIVQKLEGDQTLYKLKRHVSFCLPSEEDIRDTDEVDQDMRRKRRRSPEELGLDESQENKEDYWKVRQNVRNNSSLYPCWNRRDTSYVQKEKEKGKEKKPSIMKQTTTPPLPEAKPSKQEISYIK